ncbi:hypothetical protein [Streptomyces acidicola]|uniref:Uncharacterized protein n=1 Tax=Streptomyces acidicola TaxID=2596892 RepID=A0A5N8WIL4_9ACTN|nr:hypothetical protein [Streptomyces acidicola]MPY47164.1 hypothetical protein [Streptomyces acidicola]MPY47303.1 hypothetical protein [Streptomyces acidicola]
MASTRSTTNSSRKPRTAAATRPAAARRAPEPEPEEREDVTEAEAQEIEAEGHYVTAELCGEEVRIVPPSGWRLSWQRMLTQGLLDAFAEKVLHPDDFDFFIEIDPTAQEFQDFVQEAGERAGESLGKSGAPSRSGRPTRRR